MVLIIINTENLKIVCLIFLWKLWFNVIFTYIFSGLFDKYKVKEQHLFEIYIIFDKYKYLYCHLN